MDDYQDISPQKLSEDVGEENFPRPTLRTARTQNVIKSNNLSTLNDSARSLSPPPKTQGDFITKFNSTSNIGFQSARELSAQPQPKVEPQNRISNDFKPIVQDEPSPEEDDNRFSYSKFGVDIKETYSERPSLVLDNDMSFSQVSYNDRASPIGSYRVPRTLEYGRPSDMRSATPDPAGSFAKRMKDSNPMFYSNTPTVQQRGYSSYVEPRRYTINDTQKKEISNLIQSTMYDRRKTIDIGYLRNNDKKDNPMFWSTAQNIKKVYEPKIAEKNIFDEFLLPRGVGKILEEESENVRLMENHITQQKYKLEIDLGQILEDIHEALDVYKEVINNKLDAYLDAYKSNYRTLRDKVSAYKDRAKEYFHSDESKSKALNMKETFCPVMKGIQFYRSVADINEPFKKLKEEVCEVHGNAFAINREVSKRMIGLMTDELTKQTSHKPLYNHTESVQTHYFELKEEIVQKVKEAMVSFEETMTYVIPPEIFTKLFAFPKIESILSEDNTNLIGDSQRIVIMKIFNEKEVDFEPENTPTCLRALPNDQVAVGCKDGSVKLYNYLTGTVTGSFKAHNTSITSIDYMRLQIPELNDFVILTGSANPDCSIRAWNSSTLKCIKNLKGHKDTVTSLLPMKDGVTLLSSSFENHILIWNMNTGKLFNKVTNHSKRINVLHHLKDNARFISAGDDKTFTVWKIIYDYSNELKKRIVSNCEVEKQFEDVCEITSVNSSTDNHNIVITGGTDCKVKVWNIEKQECIKQVFAHGLGISSLLLFENPFKNEISEKYLILSTGFAENSIMGTKSGSSYAEPMVKNDSMYVELGSNSGIKAQLVRPKGNEAPKLISVNQRIGKGICIWRCE